MSKRRRKRKAKQSRIAGEQVKVPNVHDIDVALGSSHHLPVFSDLPEEYQREETPACKLASKLFFLGGPLPKVRDGIDRDRATRVVKACLRSFDPPHEHKIAGVGYLLHQWFEI